MIRSKPVACTIALMALTTSAGAQTPADATTAEPLYRVEIIVFEHLYGNRAEEDFFHGIENPRHAPVPSLFDLPRIELESVADFDRRPLAESPGDSLIEPIASTDDGTDRTDATAVAASNDDTASATGTATLTAAEQSEIGGLAPPGGAAELPQDRLELLDLAAGATTGRGRGLSGGSVQLPGGFRILRRDELELEPVRARLARSRDYHVIRHVGWLQTGVDADRAVRLDLARLGVTNPEGTIQVYLGRYLHVAVDLQYLDGRGTLWTAPPGFGLAPLEYAKRYDLKAETGRMYSGETHHIDHPLFGILVRITPAPEPEEARGTSGNGPAG